MGDAMFFGVLRMPYEMAMADEMSRHQFHSRAQEAADRVEQMMDELDALRRENAALKAQPTKALASVAAERHRQVTKEGWDIQHDDANDPGSLAGAASSYALNAACNLSPYVGYPLDEIPDAWPHDWDTSWWKPGEPRRDLVKAGALILAEIEKLDREEDAKAATAKSAAGNDLSHITAEATTKTTPAGVSAAKVPPAVNLVCELEGAANWLDALITLVQDTSCNPDDPEAFDEVMLCAQMQLAAARRAIEVAEKSALQAIMEQDLVDTMGDRY